MTIAKDDQTVTRCALCGNRILSATAEQHNGWEHGGWRRGCDCNTPATRGDVRQLTKLIEGLKND